MKVTRNFFADASPLRNASMDLSSEKSRAKSWLVMNEPFSNHPSPMRKGNVPVPPARPVVSVSRNRPSSSEKPLQSLGTCKEGRRVHAQAGKVAHPRMPVGIRPRKGDARTEEPAVLGFDLLAFNHPLQGDRSASRLRHNRRGDMVPAVHDLFDPLAQLAYPFLFGIGLDGLGPFSGEAVYPVLEAHDLSMRERMASEAALAEGPTSRLGPRTWGTRGRTGTSG